MDARLPSHDYQFLNKYIIRPTIKQSCRGKNKKNNGKAFLTALFTMKIGKCNIAQTSLATRLNNNTIDNTNTE